MDHAPLIPAASSASLGVPSRRWTLAVRAVLALGIGMLVLIGWSATASATGASASAPTAPPSSPAPPAEPGLVGGLVAEGGLLDPVLDLVTPVDPSTPSLRTPVAEVAATADPLLAPVAPTVQPALDRVEAGVVATVAPALEPVRTAVAPIVLPVAAPVGEALAPATAELPTLTAPVAEALPEVPAAVPGLDLDVADFGDGTTGPATPAPAVTAAEPADALVPVPTPSAAPDGSPAPGPVGVPHADLDGAPSATTPTAETRAPSPSPAPSPVAPAGPAVPACHGPAAAGTVVVPAAVLDAVDPHLRLVPEAAPPVLTHRLGSIPSAEPDVAPD